jgi:acyl-homoserine lactone acylase PvdQ
MTKVSAGSVVQGGKTTKVAFYQTVHGPVIGYAKVKGRQVAISRKRSTYGKDALFQLFFQQMTFGRVKNVKDYFAAANLNPQTFNSFYADDKNLGMFTSGALPLRASGVDGDLLTDGRGGFEWKGIAPASAHPQGSNPSSGLIVNWNNKPAPKFPAGDDRWHEGSIVRDQLLLAELARTNKHSLATVTAAMNAAATQDVRIRMFWPTLSAMLKRTSPPSPQTQKLADLLESWYQSGGSRLDTNNDGFIDAPGAAILDAAWDTMANSALCPTLSTKLCNQLAKSMSRFEKPPKGQSAGWYQYMNKDFKTLLGQSVKQKFSRRYCADGTVRLCSVAMWSALQQAGVKLAQTQGSDPAKWRKSTKSELIKFVPLPLITMAYTNRPSGIQQVISFDGHR